MTYPSTICRPALERLFNQNPPSTILAIGEYALEALGDWQAKADVEIIAQADNADSLTELDISGKYDVAFVTHTLECMDKTKAEQLVAALETRDVPVELLVFDDEGLGIHRLANKRVAYPAIIDFLDRHV